ncbi:hypothetical protein GsuE55_35690 [Geobacillus subterraneus]|uniref:Uncharacterized protein n=1 Tax=Geobacillus subterraneus TaxID=129338 RepID=A0A679FYC8_9BACL|nr:hypothetical protein GsuE55_35690 [Geobacillus subterraneus]
MAKAAVETDENINDNAKTELDTFNIFIPPNFFVLLVKLIIVLHSLLFISVYSYINKLDAQTSLKLEPMS